MVDLSAKLRILLVIDHLGLGGAQRQLTNLASGLRSFGHHVDVFVYYGARDFEGTMRSAGVRVIRHLKKRRFTPWVIVALARQLRRGKYNVALSYLDTPNSYLELASLAWRQTKIIVSERSNFGPWEISRRKRLQENLHRLSGYVVVNSHAHARRLRREFDWLADRVIVIHNGVAKKFFEIPVRKSANESIYLLAIATVVPIKNALLLARALGTCVREGIDIRVKWAGRHPKESIGYIEQVNRELKQQGADQHWSWLGEQKDIPALLRDADALIHPSRLEGLPNAVCEAMAAGRPVLASRVGDLPLLILNGQTGFLFDPQSVDDIVHSIKRFWMMGGEDRNVLAESARRRAEKLLTIRACTEAYLRLFDS
jgi:glycosyltransferase involved in cell wall biosynthesis